MPEVIAPQAEAPQIISARVPCCACSQPIHIDDLGGVGKGPEGQELWFHGALPCLLGAIDRLNNNHANELRSEMKAKAA